jgi:hypothetical protein
MCGRYRLSRRKQILAEHFDAVPFEDDWEPRYNIAPTHTRGRSCCPGFEPKRSSVSKQKGWYSFSDVPSSCRAPLIELAVID